MWIFDLGLTPMCVGVSLLSTRWERKALVDVGAGGEGEERSGDPNRVPAGLFVLTVVELRVVVVIMSLLMESSSSVWTALICRDSLTDG